LLLFCYLLVSPWALSAADGKPPAAPAPRPAVAEAAGPSTARTELNLLGQTNSMAGESRRNENVQFNPIDNNALKELNIRLGTSATIVSEFQPQRSYYGVEYGNTPVAALHLAPSKSVSAVHGTFFLNHGNSVFNSRAFFQVGSVKPAHENNYGVNVSAPLWRGAFLGVDGSQQKLRGNVNGNILIPMPAERIPLATDPAVRAVIIRFANAYPNVLPNRTDIDQRMLNTNAPQHINTDALSARIDQTLSARDRISARHALTSQVVDAFQLVDGQNPDTATKSHNSRLSWQHTWSANTIGDFTTGFDRVHNLLVPEPNAVGPQVQIGTTFALLGPGSAIPVDRVQNRFRQALRISQRRGRHQLTFGGEFTRLRFNGREASSNRGNFYFRNDFGRDAILNFRLGIASRYSTGLGELDRGFRNWEQHYFVGDVWQVTSKLTMNFGVRWQPILAPNEVNDRTRINFDCDCNNVGPMFGIAYRLPPRYGVIRAAYGLHYGDLPSITFQQLRWNTPEFQKIEVQAPDLLNPLKDSVISPDGRSTLFIVPRDLKAPYSHQYNFVWEAPLVSSWRIQLGYVGSRTHKLLMMWHLNRGDPVPNIPITTATINDRRPDGRYFDVRSVANGSRAYFDAARVTVVIPEWRGVSVDSSYWFSKAIDTGSAYTNTAAGDSAIQGFSQDQYMVQEDLKGPSAFDQSHAALVRLRYTSPSRLGKWVFSAIWLAKTGLPFSVISGSDGPGFGNVDGTSGDRPHLVDPSILGRTVNHPDTSVALLPRAAFRYISPGELRGSLGNNTFRRAGFSNVNASIARTFRLAGERALTLRAESINFGNSPQFAQPNNDLSAPSFGTITNTLNDGRAFQFGLQFRW
jgi:hypothetical protein